MNSVREVENFLLGLMEVFRRRHVQLSQAAHDRLLVCRAEEGQSHLSCTSCVTTDYDTFMMKEAGCRLRSPVTESGDQQILKNTAGEEVPPDDMAVAHRERAFLV